MNRILCAAAVLFLLPTICDGRVWTDSTGQRQVEASFETADDTHVYLRLADARRAQVQHDRLSDADRVYVAQRQGQPLPEPQAAGTQETATRGEIPDDVRYVYKGWGKAQHLAGKRGTTVYYRGGQFIVAALDAVDMNYSYYYYREETTNVMWRFALVPHHCWGYQVARGWDKNGDGVVEDNEYVIFYYAARYPGNMP